MTQYDDDLAERKARMAAAGRRQADRFAGSIEAARLVPVKALAVPGTRDFALGPVGPGWQLFSADRRLADGGDDVEFAQPKGGVVVEVIHDLAIDRESGEMAENTRYRCLATRWAGIPWHVIGAAEADVTQLAGIDRLGSTTAIRWLLRPVGLSERKTLTSGEIKAIGDAYRLTVAVAS